MSLTEITLGQRRAYNEKFKHNHYSPVMHFIF
jgi:hypothetical protein